MIRHGLIAAGAALVLGIGGATALGAGGPVLPLFGPLASGSCDSGAASGRLGGYGTVRFELKQGGQVLSTFVRATRLTPGTTYDVYVIQDAADCSTVDTHMTTSARGMGTAVWSEPVTSGHAVVLLWSPTSDFMTRAFVHAAP